jgi:hypothetical protein
MFDLEETIKKTKDLNDKSELVKDYFYGIYSLINSIYIPNLNDFYNASFLEQIDSELDVIIKKLKYVENEFSTYSNKKENVKELIPRYEEAIVKSIHTGDFLIQNIIDQAKIEESHEKKNFIQ